MQHSPSTLCNPWRKNLNDSNFWSCKCCWDRQALLGLCVWLHSCSQTAGISLGMLPLARQVLSSSRLSLTHTASPKGWDPPAFTQHCTICCTIFCSSRAQYYWPSIFQDRVRPTALPHTVTNLGWPEAQQPLPTAGSESCFLLHSCLFAFNILPLSKILLRLSADFSIQRVFLLSVQSEMINSIDSSKIWPKKSVRLQVLWSQ